MNICPSNVFFKINIVVEKISKDHDCIFNGVETIFGELFNTT